MKRQLFVLFSLYITICNVNGQLDLERMNQYRQDCIREIGINAASFDMKNPTKDQYCFFKCIGQKIGVIDADGNNIQMPLDHNDNHPELSQELKEKVEECFKIRVDDKCEQAYKQHECAMKVLPKM